MQQSNRNYWNVRFDVTFYGNDPNKGSFREIKKDNIVYNEEFKIENKLPLIMLQVLKLTSCFGSIHYQLKS